MTNPERRMIEGSQERETTVPRTSDRYRAVPWLGTELATDPAHVVGQLDPVIQSILPDRELIRDRSIESILFLLDTVWRQRPKDPEVLSGLIKIAQRALDRAQSGPLVDRARMIPEDYADLLERWHTAWTDILAAALTHATGPRGLTRPAEYRPDHAENKDWFHPLISAAALTPAFDRLVRPIDLARLDEAHPDLITQACKTVTDARFVLVNLFWRSHPDQFKVWLAEHPETFDEPALYRIPRLAAQVTGHMETAAEYADTIDDLMTTEPTLLARDLPYQHFLWNLSWELGSSPLYVPSNEAFRTDHKLPAGTLPHADNPGTLVLLNSVQTVSRWLPRLRRIEEWGRSRAGRGEAPTLPAQRAKLSLRLLQLLAYQVDLEEIVNSNEEFKALRDPLLGLERRLFPGADRWLPPSPGRLPALDKRFIALVGEGVGAGAGPEIRRLLANSPTLHELNWRLGPSFNRLKISERSGHEATVFDQWVIYRLLQANDLGDPAEQPDRFIPWPHAPHYSYTVHERTRTIRRLALADRRITTLDGITTLADVEELDLRRCGVTSIEALLSQPMPSLRSLNIEHLPIDEAELDWFSQLHPNCTVAWTPRRPGS